MDFSESNNKEKECLMFNVHEKYPTTTLSDEHTRKTAYTSAPKKGVDSNTSDNLLFYGPNR